MANAYSQDLRERAIALIDEGKHINEVSDILKIDPSTSYSWLKRRRLAGDITAKKDWRKGYRPKVDDLEKFRNFAEENRNLTALDMAKKWGNISGKTILKWLHRIGFTRKKKVMV